MFKGRKEAEEDMEKAGCGRKCEVLFEKGRCTLPIEVECLRKSDYCWVEVNLVTLTCWGCYKISNIGVSLPLMKMCHIQTNLTSTACVTKVKLMKHLELDAFF